MTWQPVVAQEPSRALHMLPPRPCGIVFIVTLPPTWLVRDHPSPPGPNPTAIPVPLQDEIDSRVILGRDRLQRTQAPAAVLSGGAGDRRRVARLSRRGRSSSRRPRTAARARGGGPRRRPRSSRPARPSGARTRRPGGDGLPALPARRPSRAPASASAPPSSPPRAPPRRSRLPPPAPRPRGRAPPSRPPPRVAAATSSVPPTCVAASAPTSPPPPPLRARRRAQEVPGRRRAGASSSWRWACLTFVGATIRVRPTHDPTPAQSSRETSHAVTA